MNINMLTGFPPIALPVNMVTRWMGGPMPLNGMVWDVPGSPISLYWDFGMGEDGWGVWRGWYRISGQWCLILVVDWIPFWGTPGDM